MKRKEGWEIILNQFLMRHQNKPFKWGENDCCLFACNAIWEMTGTDPAQWFRNRYNTKQGAYDLLAEFADGEILETAIKITFQFNMPEIKPGFAQRGDVVYMQGVMGYCLGIISMDGSIAIPGEKQGLLYYPVEKSIYAWGV